MQVSIHRCFAVFQRHIQLANEIEKKNHEIEFL